MDANVPTLIRPALHNYLDQVHQQLPGLLHGFHLEGSVALGDFNERFSDIDFMALLTRQATSPEIRTLRQIHRQVEQTYPFPLSGRYFPVTDLTQWKEPLVEPLVSQLHFHDGVLQPLIRPFDPHSVEGWLLKYHGITLLGPEIRIFPFSVNWAIVVERMRENLNTYWKGWTRHPYRLMVMLSDWGIQWTVLGCCGSFIPCGNTP
ncbi:hypothetical protein [Nibrella saemangeumensis]|uniref:hypothetical protein n=1 Tax=Nibrella saemangeumensis TaxID=1084526 RepID=UPI0031ED33CE